jgi:hypothetical protein
MASIPETARLVKVLTATPNGLCRVKHSEAQQTQLHLYAFPPQYSSYRIQSDAQSCERLVGLLAFPQSTLGCCLSSADYDLGDYVTQQAGRFRARKRVADEHPPRTVPKPLERLFLQLFIHTLAQGYRIRERQQQPKVKPLNCD